MYTKRKYDSVDIAIIVTSLSAWLSTLLAIIIAKLVL
jgi:hypothetical protein